jgi:Holliday junction resolvase
MYIIKANGEKQEFSPNKIRRSCLRSGATPALADEITKRVSRQVRNGMTTKEIWQMVFRYLGKEAPDIASRFSLKNALFQLGPTGFYFEQLVARIFNLQGYWTQTNQIFSGECVDHEVDILAKKDDEILMIECKFHNQFGIYTDIKDALYSWARWLDLKAGSVSGKCPKFTQPVLVSNTKFSEQVKKYATCKNFPLIGWSYPEDKNLQYFIEQNKLYPITVLRRLDKYHQEKLLKYGIITCLDLIKVEARQVQREIGLDPRKISMLQSEANLILR